MDKNRSNRLSNAAKKRRSSILKNQRPPRTPFSELEFNIATPGEKSRRVSFSRRTDVVEFVTHEATTTWKDIYFEHNKSDSLGNESDPVSAVVVNQNVRIFENQFQEIETECVNTVGNPKSLIQMNSTFNDTNFTNPIILEQSNDEVKIKPPTQNFELSYFTEKASKVFGSESINPNFGETSGRIEIDFSDIHTIETDRPVKDDLDEITDDLGRVDNNLLGGPFRGRNVSQYIEVDLDMTHRPNEQSDMSITDTITDPKVQEVLKSSYQDPKRKTILDQDWITDKENIIVNPSCESDDLPVKEVPEKVLVFDGKKLKYASIDADLDELIDPTVNKSKNKGSLSNMLVDYDEQASTSANMGRIASESHSSVNLSTMRNVQVTYGDLSLNAEYKKRDISVLEENLIFKQTNKPLSVAYKNDFENIQATQEDNIIPIQQFTSEIHHRKTIEVNVHDDLPNFETEVPIVQNTSLKHKEPLNVNDYLKPSQSKIYDADMSLTKSLVSLSEIPPRRTTIHFGDDDKMGDISITQGVIGTMSNTEKQNTNILNADRNNEVILRPAMNVDDYLQQSENNLYNVDSSKANDLIGVLEPQSRRTTIHFNNDDRMGDISVTQGVIGTISTNTEKRKTNIIEPEHGKEGISVSTINDLLQPSKSTIYDADMSVTKHVIGNLEVPSRRTTLHFDDDDMMGDISVTQGVIGIISSNTDKRNTNIFDTELNKEENLPVVLNVDDYLQQSKYNIYGADMSKTDSYIGELESQPRRTTIHFNNNDRMGDISVTQGVIGIMSTNSEKRQPPFEPEHDKEAVSQSGFNVVNLVQPSKSNIYDANISVTNDIGRLDPPLRRTTIHFDNDNRMGDISITQGVIGLISANTKNRKTILFESTDIGADISMTQALPSAINIYKETTCHNNKSTNSPAVHLPSEEIQKQSKRQTILFDKDDGGDISMTQCVNNRSDIKTHGRKSTYGNQDMSVTEVVINKLVPDELLDKNKFNNDLPEEAIKNILPLVTQGNTRINQLSITNNKPQLQRKTIILNVDDDLPNFVAKEIPNISHGNIIENSVLVPKLDLSKSKIFDGDMSVTEAAAIKFNEKLLTTDAVANKLFINHEYASQNTKDYMLKLCDDINLRKVLSNDNSVAQNPKRNTIHVGDINVTNTKIGIIESGLRRKTTHFDSQDDIEANIAVIKPSIEIIASHTTEKRRTVIFESSNVGADVSNTQTVPDNFDVQNYIEQSLNNTKNINDFMNVTQPGQFTKTNINDVTSRANIESILNKNKSLLINSQRNTIDFNNKEDADLTECLTNVQNSDTISQMSKNYELKTNKLDNSSLGKEDSQSFLSDSFIEKVDNSLTTDFNADLSKSNKEFVRKSEINKCLLLTDSLKTNPYKIETLVLNVNESSPNKLHQNLPMAKCNESDNMKQLNKDDTKVNVILETDELQSIKLQENNEIVDISMTEVKDLPDGAESAKLDASYADVSMTQAVEPTFNGHNQDVTTMLNNISLAQAMLRKSEIDFCNVVDDSIEPSQEEFPQPRKISIRDCNDVARTLQFDIDVDENEQTVTDSDIKQSPLKKATVAETTLIKETNKSIVIPPYVINADKIKELMVDLVKPMADVPLEINSDNIKSVNTNIQANLNTSSQIDMDVDVFKTKSPTTKTTTSKNTKKDKKRYTTIVPTEKVLTFDHTNPLNNVSLPSLANIEVHKYNPITIEEKKIIEKEINDKVLLESVNDNIVMIDDKAELKIIKDSLAYSNKSKNIKETEVNTVIIMKNNKELLTETSLTIFDDEIFDVKNNKTDKSIKTDEFEDKLTIKNVSRKRNYSPTKYEPSELIKVNITPKPQNKILRKSNSPLETKSPEKTLAIEVDNDKYKFHEDISETKVENKLITTQLIKECYGVNKLDAKSKHIVMDSLKKVQTETKSKCISVKFEEEADSLRDNDQSMIEDGDNSAQETADYYTAQDSELVNAVKKMSFMGSKMCEWESETPTSWCFLLFHSRLRLTISFSKSTTQVTDDTFVSDIGVDIVKEDENPVAFQCIVIADRCIKHLIKTVSLISAEEIPKFLRKLVVTLYQTKRWGQVMEDCRLRLAYTFTSDGYVMLKVANTHLRTVWEVMIQTDVTSHPIARAITVKCLLTKQEVKEGEIAKVVGKVPEDWGHVPSTLWKIFRHLKNKTKSDNHLLGF